MGFGGLYPLPLRLGGKPEEGLSPDQHARLSSDVAAMHSSASLAVLRVDVASGVATISTLISRGGYASSAVTATYSSPNLVIAFGNRYEDDDQKIDLSWCVLGAMASIVGIGPSPASVAANAVTIAMSTGQSVVVVVFGGVEARTCWEYGADLDKKRSTSEGEVPYAWTWLLDQEAQKGSAYSSEPDALTRYEAIAKARVLGFCQRMSETHACQQLAVTADGELLRWAEIMGISTGKKDWEIRNAAAARMLLFSGCVDETLTAAVTRVMGAAFVGLYRTAGTLLSPPAPTFWLHGTVGPFNLSLDADGAWTTRRCHVTIGLQRVAGESDTVIFRTAENELAEILANALPAVASYTWGFGADGGFTLGVDRLGRDLL